MKDVVCCLQDGWYSNDNCLQQTDNKFTRKANCEGLIRKAKNASNKEFIPLFPGLEGQIEELTIDQGHFPNWSEIPIDSLVVDLTKDLDPDDKIDDGCK